jgi:hypothetical protein
MTMTDCGGAVLQNEWAEHTSRFGTFEPLLGGDRQKEKRVAKARNPLQRGPFEVSLS